MTLSETMAALEAAGSEQTRKTYRRHGISREMFGVSYATLGKLRKKIKVDQALAEELWETGNHDARVLASMIADPDSVSERTVAKWIQESDHSAIYGEIVKLVFHTKFSLACFENWRDSKKDEISSAAWMLLACMTQDGVGAPATFWEEQLEAIEQGIHSAQNSTRYTMNSALIAIGGNIDALEKNALAAARRIGHVEVDHGDTCCKTPDATAYIQKMRARKNPKAKA